MRRMRGSPGVKGCSSGIALGQGAYDDVTKIEGRTHRSSAKLVDRNRSSSFR